MGEKPEDPGARKGYQDPTGVPSPSESAVSDPGSAGGEAKKAEDSGGKGSESARATTVKGSKSNTSERIGGPGPDGPGSNA